MTKTRTMKGYQLAEALNPSIGTTRAITEVCSRLCRLAATYHRMQERAGNGHQDWQGNWDEMAAKRDEEKESRIEEQIKKLCLQLPLVDGKAIEPMFEGDPRGAVVKLKMPDG